MKIVKLNRNYNINKYHDFEVGIKFDYWGREAQQFEHAAADYLGDQAWAWKHHSDKKLTENWAGTFGKRVKHSSTPYWIYIRHESMLTLVLLTMNQKDQT